MRPAALPAVAIPLILSLALSAPAAGGHTWHVLPGGGGDAPTIQAAIDAAASGDTVQLADGVFADAGNRDISFLGKALVVRSASRNPATCIIDCGGAPGDFHRGFWFASGEGEASVLDGVTVRNGYVDPDCAHEEFCDESSGGAILCTGSSGPTIVNCRFEDSSARWGGGVCAYRSSPIIRLCTFARNSAYDGAGISGKYSDASLEQCTFRGNVAAFAGGGVDIRYKSAMTVTGCRVEENRAAMSGGGVVVGVNSAPVIEQTIVANNVCDSDGGGLHCRNSAPTLSAVTFYGNEAPEGGGAHLGNHAAPIFEQVIIAFGEEGEAVYCEDDETPELSCCDIYGNAGGDWTGCIAGQSGLYGNISADPIFCDPEEGDFGLKLPSPCLGAAGCGLIGADGEGCVATSVDGAGVEGGRLAGDLSVWPNPAASEVNLRFGAPVSAPARLTVYDIRGRAVRSIGLPPGARSAVWDGTNAAGRRAAAGVYFLAVDSAGRSVVRRVTLVR